MKEQEQETYSSVERAAERMTIAAILNRLTNLEGHGLVERLYERLTALERRVEALERERERERNEQED